MTPIFLALGCAVAWLGANIAIQPESRRYGALAALVYSQAVAMPFAVAVAWGVDGAPNFPATTTGTIALVVAIASAFIAYFGLFLAIEKGQLSLAAPVIAGWSVIAALIGIVVFDERLKIPTAVGALLILGATIRIAMPEESQPSPGTRGLGAAFASALGFGVMVAAVKVLGESTGALWAVVFTWSGQWVLALTVLVTRQKPRRLPDGPFAWLRLLRPGGFEFVGFALIALAVESGPMALVAPISNLSTTLTVLFGLFVLKERLSRGRLIAVTAVCLGVILVSI